MLEWSNQQLLIKKNFKDPVLRAKELKKVKDNRIHCALWIFSNQCRADDFNYVK